MITMQMTKVLSFSVLTAVIIAIAALAYGLHIAQANTPERAIPAMDATSPSAGAIRVTWEPPSDTDTLNSYRVSWSQDSSGMTSYKEDNSATGGNAYPASPASSYTITGLDAGAYYVSVRARYDDGDNGAFKKTGPVQVAGTAQTDESEDDSTPTATPEPTPEATPEPAATPEPDRNIPPEPDRNIPAIGVASPSAGAIDIIWGAPSETGTLNSYRVSWSQDASGDDVIQARPTRPPAATPILTRPPRRIRSLGWTPAPITSQCALATTTGTTARPRRRVPYGSPARRSRRTTTTTALPPQRRLPQLRQNPRPQPHRSRLPKPRPSLAPSRDWK